jgi:hypothetical protein
VHYVGHYTDSVKVCFYAFFNYVDCNLKASSFKELPLSSFWPKILTLLFKIMFICWLDWQLNDSGKQLFGINPYLFIKFTTMSHCPPSGLGSCNKHTVDSKISITNHMGSHDKQGCTVTAVQPIIWNFMFCWTRIFIYACKETNLMHYLSPVY